MRSGLTEIAVAICARIAPIEESGSLREIVAQSVEPDVASLSRLALLPASFRSLSQSNEAEAIVFLLMVGDVPCPLESGVRNFASTIGLNRIARPRKVRSK